MNMITERAIRQVVGRGIPKPANDQNTDDIMPARFMKEITFANMGKYVYFDERFAKNGTLVEEHPFNNKKYRGANILLAGANYGCGSSREHAPQALYKYGIRAIIAESFAEIFAGNCASLGIVGVTVASKDLASTSEAVKLNPSIEIEVDLAEKTVKCGTSAIKIEIPEGRRQAFLNGTWDAMAILQQNQGNVADVEKRLAYLHYE
jgi:3-isopropylmalate/(R)-2-methylmalate dehydratase small subunit